MECAAGYSALNTEISTEPGGFCGLGFAGLPTECISTTASPSETPLSTHPTTNPTSKPTGSPTTTPSTTPSSAPSPSTSYPSSAPSLSTEPSTAPTSQPTSNPTANPTLSPTTQPTDEPTSQPTSTPTANPTLSPTTSHPSEVPTRAPTNSPSPWYGCTNKCWTGSEDCCKKITTSLIVTSRMTSRILFFDYYNSEYEILADTGHHSYVQEKIDMSFRTGASYIAFSLDGTVLFLSGSSLNVEDGKGGIDSFLGQSGDYSGRKMDASYFYNLQGLDTKDAKFSPGPIRVKKSGGELLIVDNITNSLYMLDSGNSIGYPKVYPNSFLTKIFSDPGNGCKIIDFSSDACDETNQCTITSEIIGVDNVILTSYLVLLSCEDSDDLVYRVQTI